MFLIRNYSFLQQCQFTCTPARTADYGRSGVQSQAPYNCFAMAEPTTDTSFHAKVNMSMCDYLSEDNVAHQADISN